jgi:2'-hydroxyisoflavone reductase
MRLLVLGGTVFVGRHIVEEALARGHDVTLFNRGRTNRGLFANVEQLRGDRERGDLAALAGRSWDAAADTSGYVPRVVAGSAQLLAGAVSHYTFISTGAVYADYSRPRIAEDSPVATLEDETSEDVGRHYGALKALCERAAEAALPGRVLSVRAGVVVGPHDPTGRFTYWVHRIARGGDVVAPEPRDQLVQLIDGRDLAAWILDAAERRLAGRFNLAGPARPLTMEGLLAEIRAATESDARLVWIGERLLLARGVEPARDLPLWVAPGAYPESAYFFGMEIGKALAAGLRHRPLADTVTATLEHATTVPGVGLDPARERALREAARGPVADY